MSYELINSVCYYICTSSLAAVAVLSIVSIWIPNTCNYNFMKKSIATTIILFTVSALGALVTKLLTI